MITKFTNEPDDFLLSSENQEEMQKTLNFLNSQAGQEYPIIIGGEKIYTQEKIVSINPGNINETIGYVAKADLSLAEKAIETAQKAFEVWKRVSPEHRAMYLFKMAAIMRRRKIGPRVY